jgi:Tfp pilus assembly major pilin PilA
MVKRIWLSMNQKGYLMIEVIIMVVVLAVISSAIGMYVLSHQAVMHANNEVTATFLAQKQIELLKGNENSLEFDSFGEKQTESVKVVQNGTTFIIKTNFKGTHEARELIKVEVLVSWQEQNSDKNLVLSTFLMESIK